MAAAWTKLASSIQPYSRLARQPDTSIRALTILSHSFTLPPSLCEWTRQIVYTPCHRVLCLSYIAWGGGYNV